MVNHEYPKGYLYKRMVQAKLFIDAHYSEKIDLDDIADEACFSKFHFIRLFRSLYGKTPHQYLTAVRMQHARTLLERNITVTDTCYKVGFESPASFTAAFRTHVKCSPSVYQQQYFARTKAIRSQPLRFIPACFANQYGWL